MHILVKDGKGEVNKILCQKKEIQKDASKLLQCKLAIHEAFHHIDLFLCLEGSLQESAFNSKGKSNSEDIFCAKYGAKDLVLD